MKVLTLITSVLFSIITGCGTEKENPSLSYSELATTHNEQKDSILVNIQNKIDSEFTRAFVVRKTEGMDRILSALEKIESPISLYWQAYIKYNKSIYYSVNKNPEKSEAFLDESIALIENNVKSSESYALLGTLLNFSIQFKSPMAAGLIGEKSKKSFEKAIKLEPKNLRAYLGMASLDFYTPEKYGGKKETVKYIKKALAQPDQPLRNPMLPSWGRNTAYEIIINYYLEAGDKEKAKAYYKEAIEKIPNDYQLNSLSKKLI